MSAAAAFDQLAARYDELWTHSAVGRTQREAVWREIGTLFRPGERVLDLGCGTGEDAARLERIGARVYAIDASPQMVAITRQRLGSGSACDVLAVEDLARLMPGEKFDGALANFGVLNCVADLRPVAAELARLVRPGGRVALCLMGRFCLWETVWYLLRGEPGKAFRRRRGAVRASPGFPVFYPPAAAIVADFAPAFRLARRRGIGVFVPPSYVKAPPGLCAVLAWLDRLLAGWPLLRSMGDHCLLTFVRK
ncbi:MAG TPA: methyltransferase domain-containing protein [Bryobacterales bacterium]|nr:methyltransferase domain-containing protein [Bryobacterales bacterium]